MEPAPDEQPPENDPDEQQPEKKPRNFARDIPRNFTRLTKEVIRARPGSRKAILALRDRLFAGIWGENLTREEQQEQLFAFGPWDKLKMAVLDARCCPLPDHKVPTSAEQLIELCQKLLDRTNDNYMRDHFVAGWAGCPEGGASTELKAFCHQLWQTRSNDPEFFRAVVTGRHGSAVSYLVNERTPLGLTADRAVRLIYRMALTWCAHDVQASAARARRSMKGPFAWLHGNVEGKRMRAGTVFAIWRPVYTMLTGNTGRYRTNEEARMGKPESKPTRHSDVNDIKAVAESALDRQMLREFPRQRRDGLLTDAKELAQTQDDLFWNEVRRDETSKEVAQLQISQVWYHGLTPLQVIAVSVIRLVQMEAILEKRIASMYSHPIGGEIMSPPLLPFSEADLPHGWRTRALRIVDDLRRVILKDVDHGSRREEVREGDGALSHDETYIDGALAFLSDALQQPLPNDPNEPIEGMRRTLSLLNVCAVVRLAR